MPYVVRIYYQTTISLNHNDMIDTSEINGDTILHTII